MEQTNLNLKQKLDKPLPYFVMERDGRYLVLRRSPTDAPLVIEDCRTKAFADACCANYNTKAAR
jgi:hypothetical protein